MIDISVCAETVYTEKTFDERIPILKKSGVNTVEFWQWHNKNIDAIANALRKNQMKISAFCIDSADPDISQMISRNALNIKAEDRLIKAVLESIKVAKYLKTKNLIITVGDSVAGMSYQEQFKNIVYNLNLIKEYFEKEQITLLVEPINRQERSEYLIPNVKNLIPVIDEVKSDNIKILYDIYHQSMENDFSTEDLISALPYVGHIHVADCPGRGEPGTGKIDFTEVFHSLSDSNYDKYLGFEFFPIDKDCLSSLFSETII